MRGMARRVPVEGLVPLTVEPPTPFEVLLVEFLIPRRLSGDATVRLGVLSLAEVDSLAAGYPLTVDQAQRIAQATQTDPAWWLDLQRSHTAWRAHQRV